MTTGDLNSKIGEKKRNLENVDNFLYLLLETVIYTPVPANYLISKGGQVSSLLSSPL